jgi:hypothetical protein
MVSVFPALSIAVGDPDTKEHVPDEGYPKAGTNGLIPLHIMLESWSKQLLLRDMAIHTC